MKYCKDKNTKDSSINDRNFTLQFMLHSFCFRITSIISLVKLFKSELACPMRSLNHRILTSNRPCTEHSMNVNIIAETNIFWTFRFGLKREYWEYWECSVRINTFQISINDQKWLIAFAWWGEFFFFKLLN